MKKQLITALAILLASSALAEQLPFRNTKLSLDERTADLVNRLTLDEKINMLSETAPAVERLGIDGYNHGNEALHGIVRPGKFTVFPRPMGLAATFNPDLIEEMADCISDEARGRYNELGRKCVGGRFGGQFNGLLTFWSPNVNMARDPRWGRTGETYGEDPLLTARMGTAFTLGLQGGKDPKYLKTVATPKHYVANNEEHNRFECKAEIPERSLREYYLRGFKGCVVDGGAESIMAAYNAVNGIPCSVNKKLLTDILRDEWGFDGYVVGDLNSPVYVYSRHKYFKTQEETAAALLKAGLDLDSGFKPFRYIKKAIDKGLCTEEDVDRAATRVLRARFKLGMYDPIDMVPYNTIKPEIVGCERHQQLALELARQSMVLLKNDGLLPFGKDVKKVALIGPCIDIFKHPHYSVYEGTPNPPITPLTGIQTACEERNIELTVIDWASLSSDNSRVKKVESRYLKPSKELDGKTSGLTGSYYGESFKSSPLGERVDPEIDFDRAGKAPDTFFIQEPLHVRWTGQLLPPISGSYTLAFTYDDGARVWVNGEKVFDDWSKAASRTKKVKKEFKADEPVEIKIEYFDAGGGAVAKLQWAIPEQVDSDPLDKITADMDAVILVMGLDDNHTGEGFDKTDLDLPKDQADVIRRVYECNKNIALVMMNSTVLTINWEQENIPAILEAFYPGEKTGTALSEILWGDISPSGKLPLTFCKSADDLPPFNDYDMTKGRTYLYSDKAPLYPFGHGLSYSSFEYGKLKLKQNDETLKVTLKVKNIGAMDADEVVQAYVTALDAPVKTPLKELVDFERISIKAGKKAKVKLEIPLSELNYYNEAANSFEQLSGRFELRIGSSCENIRQTATFTVQ